MDSERVDSSVSTEGRTSLQDRHLLSPLQPLPFILTSLPWRTFTLSTRLPHGVWLLRRLRPPSSTLAFSRPALCRCSCIGVPPFQAKIHATRIILIGVIGRQPRGKLNWTFCPKMSDVGKTTPKRGAACSQSQTPEHWTKRRAQRGRPDRPLNF